jgi:hypothetical protein
MAFIGPLARSDKSHGISNRKERQATVETAASQREFQRRGFKSRGPADSLVALAWRSQDCFGHWRQHVAAGMETATFFIQTAAQRKTPATRESCWRRI